MDREGKARRRRIGGTFRAQHLPVARTATKNVDSGKIVHPDKEQVCTALREHLGGEVSRGRRYRTAQSAPIARRKLF